MHEGLQGFPIVLRPIPNSDTSAVSVGIRLPIYNGPETISEAFCRLVNKPYSTHRAIVDRLFSIIHPMIPSSANTLLGVTSPSSSQEQARSGRLALGAGLASADGSESADGGNRLHAVVGNDRS